MNKLDKFYNSFSKMVIPEDASEDQRKDMKMSFYSGAVALISCIYLLKDDNGKDFNIEFNNLTNEIFDKMEEFTTK